MTGNGIFVTTFLNPLPILEDRLGTLVKDEFIYLILAVDNLDLISNISTDIFCTLRFGSSLYEAV
jgi:hypothetical protein